MRSAILLAAILSPAFQTELLLKSPRFSEAPEAFFNGLLTVFRERTKEI